MQSQTLFINKFNNLWELILSFKKILSVHFWITLIYKESSLMKIKFKIVYTYIYAVAILFDVSLNVCPTSIGFYTYMPISIFHSMQKVSVLMQPDHCFMYTWMDMSAAANTHFTVCSHFYENMERFPMLSDLPLHHFIWPSALNAFVVLIMLVCMAKRFFLKWW